MTKRSGLFWTEPDRFDRWPNASIAGEASRVHGRTPSDDNFTTRKQTCGECVQMRGTCISICCMQQPAQTERPHSQGVIPSEPEQAAVRALIRAEGERAAGAKLNLDRTTLARVAAGLGV